MAIKNRLGVKQLTLRIPADLHTMLKRLSIDHGITVTDIIVQYLKFLKKKPHRIRKGIDVKSDTDFELDVGDS